VAFLSHLGDRREPVFWGHHLPQELVRAFGRGEFDLELVDATASRQQLGELCASKPWRFSSVYPVLATPVVDGLTAHAEITSDVGDLPPRGDQVQDPSPELRWMTLPHADLLPRLRHEESNDATPRKWGNIKVVCQGGSRGRPKNCCARPD
jgi:hypothetical protein